MNGARIAAVDIGGTKIKGCIFTGGEAAQAGEIDSEAKQGANHLLERAAELLERLAPFDAVGISTAGQVDPKTGSIRYANDNIPGYTGTDVRSYFEKRFSCPAAVMNDVYAAALGEGAKGAAQGESDYLCITFGTGIGGGVVLDGCLYYGAGASAGVMLGGIITHPEAVRPGEPFSGTFERYASNTALMAAAYRIDPALPSGRDIFRRLEEPPMKQAVDHWLDEVAAGVCTLIHAYNVPCVILGGGVMEQPYAINGACTRIKERIIPGFSGVRVTGAKLGNLAGLYGAASMAAQRL